MGSKTDFKVRPGDQDTICALATAAGIGAIAVVRISGSRSFEIARKVASFLPSDDIESHRAYFGTLKKTTRRDLGDSLNIDEALVTTFVHGKSFTGEESAEFSVHGGGLIAGKLLEELILLGARLAKPGEFT